jgi:hypothetical protein
MIAALVAPAPRVVSGLFQLAVKRAAEFDGRATGGYDRSMGMPITSASSR